jgi:TonB family protein
VEENRAVQPSTKITLSDELHFDVEEGSRRGGVSAAVLVSLVLHALLIIYFIRNYRPVTESDRVTPMVHYVELIRQNPQFTEAPGAKTKTAPLNAAFSDANRRASMPNPTAEKPTTRPGQGGFYAPPAAKSGSEDSARARQAQAAESELTARPSQESSASSAEGATFTYRPSQQKASTGIDWRNAIREVGKIASIGTGQQGMDLGNQGGEKGFAESGPLSFETQWYDWGEYAQSMVSRIRVNWYNNMPQLIQTGLKGVVTIRFTIQRDGQITDVTLLNSSGAPPYDFAAKKAIELSSPLNPLPKDFPNPTERVTCMFFYNQEVPNR